jgi:lipopolysaccharide/colanic/teichoic acid biosynthesis glycosyltransferase
MFAIKRIFDVVCTIAGLAVLSPILLVVTLLVFLEDFHSPFFRQERIGEAGRPFRIWKFRSMRPDAERVGPQISVGRDVRATRIGRILRATKLDELPQLLNVLRGEMSLVGPRPEVRRYVQYYTEEQRSVLALRPGITDPASVRYRNEAEVLAAYADPHQAYRDIVMPDKIRINLWYAAHATLWTDVIVILATIGLGGKAFDALGIPMTGDRPIPRVRSTG